MSYLYVFFTIGTHPFIDCRWPFGTVQPRFAGVHKEGAMSQDDKSVLSSEQNRTLVTELADSCTLGRIM